MGLPRRSWGYLHAEGEERKRESLGQAACNCHVLMCMFSQPVVDRRDQQRAVVLLTQQPQNVQERLRVRPSRARDKDRLPGS